MHDLNHSVEINRFGNDVHGPNELRLPFAIVDGAQHDNGNRSQGGFGEPLLFWAESPSVHDRHGEVEENSARAMFVQPAQGHPAVLGRRRRKPGKHQNSATMCRVSSWSSTMRTGRCVVGDIYFQTLGDRIGRSAFGKQTPQGGRGLRSTASDTEWRHRLGHRRVGLARGNVITPTTPPMATTRLAATGCCPLCK